MQQQATNKKPRNAAGFCNDVVTGNRLKSYKGYCFAHYHLVSHAYDSHFAIITLPRYKISVIEAAAACGKVFPCCAGSFGKGCRVAADVIGGRLHSILRLY